VDIRTFQANRAAFPEQDLRIHDGRWVAFSSDATRIVASAETLDELEQQLVARAIDPEEVALERVDFSELSSIGGAEFL
jgi:hypothetical protein